MWRLSSNFPKEYKDWEEKVLGKEREYKKLQNDISDRQDRYNKFKIKALDEVATIKMKHKLENISNAELKDILQ